jgi:hypothetical protein
MPDSVPNKLSWAEIASCISLPEHRISKAAQSFFNKDRFRRSKYQARRSLIRRVSDLFFDSNLSLIDIAEIIYSEIKENADARALENCISKMKGMEKEGWFRCHDVRLNTILTWHNITIHIEPHAILKNGNDICLLYAYFRKSPPLSTDATRALLQLLRIVLQGQEHEGARIVVLDCYKDESFENCDFDSNERWVERKITKVLDRFAMAYSAAVDSSPPADPPRLGSGGDSGVTPNVPAERFVRIPDGGQLKFALS